jgi:hypothetical protein
VNPWQFTESFAIRSGSSKIVGTISGSGPKKDGPGCDGIGPVVLRYATTGGHKHKGKAEITTIQQGDFNETLLRL